MKDGFNVLAGRLVSDAELALLLELGKGDRAHKDSSLGVNVATGWTVLRRLSSLEARGLVEQYMHESGLTAWRLAPAARLAVTR